MSGNVIKAGEARMLTRGMYSLDLRDIARDAAAALADAKAKGNQLIEDARAEAMATRETIFEEAKRAGYAQGHTEGFQAGTREALEQATATFEHDHAALTSALEAALQEFNENKDMFYTAARCDVVTLAVAIARRIVSSLTESDAAACEAAEAACAEALGLISRASDVRVLVNPADKSAMAEMASNTNKVCESVRHIEIVEDDSVARGGVVVEAAECDIDGSVRTRVERIADELVADWRRRMEKLDLE